MATAIRPLTFLERKSPARLTYYGGFKNVSFQIGIIEHPDSATQNTNGAIPAYLKAFLRKSPTIQFPLMLPRALTVDKGYTNTVCSVVGQKNNMGGFDALLVARNNERLSTFSSKLRTVEDLLKNPRKQNDEEENRLGKSSNARVHNQVMLAGLVYSAKFEDGETPRFHIGLRQDSNPDNVIPLTYEARNASAMLSRVTRGALIYVDGEYAFRPVIVYKRDEEGKFLLDENRNKIPELDSKGAPVKKIHTYIRITAPKDPSEFDLDFGSTPPRIVVELAEEIAATRERSQAKASHAAEPGNPISVDAVESL